MKPVIHIKRAYDKATKTDGQRVLIDRLWPRGLSKKKAAIDQWTKEIAPTPALRKLFGHDPDRWKEFQKRYKAELKQNKAVKEFAEDHKKTSLITLLYAGKDAEHTHALVLQKFLQRLFASK